MIVPKLSIPEPYENTLSRWHILAFGLFANRPMSDDEEYLEMTDSDDDTDTSDDEADEQD